MLLCIRLFFFNLEFTVFSHRPVAYSEALFSLWIRFLACGKVYWGNIGKKKVVGSSSRERSRERGKRRSRSFSAYCEARRRFWTLATPVKISRFLNVFGKRNTMRNTLGAEKRKIVSPPCEPSPSTRRNRREPKAARNEKPVGIRRRRRRRCRHPLRCRLLYTNWGCATGVGNPLSVSCNSVYPRPCSTNPL